MTEALEPHGTRVGKWPAPKIFSTYSYIETWTKTLCICFVDNIWHKKSVYVRSGTGMDEAISKWWDWINSTVQRIPQWWKIRKISTRKPTARMVCYVFLSNKYPKIAKKSVRPFLLVKHSVPTLTDETKVTICVEKEITGMFFTGDKNQSASTPRSNRGVRCFGDPRSGCALRIMMVISLGCTIISNMFCIGME